jgi:glycosyltransferase involved in cell wall biosynthesis
MQMQMQNAEAQAFRPGVRKGLVDAVGRLAESLGGGGEDLMRIDLHCHDRNSDVPDETLGRLLRVPETWLPTAGLVRTLGANGADVITVTNHNNARSCWELLEAGEDVLPAAEFSCTLPDLDVGVHVLAYGFAPEQEERLNRLRRDIYRFLEFAADRDIPTVLAHPLHFYSPKGTPSLDLMDRFALLFERFEGVNGQRDAWQNLLTLSWLEGLDEEGILAASRRAGIRPGSFCRRPWRKLATGGSDCHMGIFAGSTGTLLKVPGWRAAGGSRAGLALQALRDGEMAPFGSHCEEEKLTAAFLDYFCQVALRMEDPGLVRLLLHRGAPAEKAQALLIANGMLELRRHKYTSRFLGLFHDCLQGRKPGLFTSLLTSPAYKPLLADMAAIAGARRRGAEALVPALGEILPRMFGRLSSLLADRILARSRALESRGLRLDGAELLARFELPVHLRALFGAGSREHGRARAPGGRAASAAADKLAPKDDMDLGKWSDGLPFPALASAVLGGAAFAASKVLYGKRPFLEAFARRIGKHRHPRRVLWLTDTLADRNGVSHALQAMLGEARRRGLPIDFLACRPASEGPGQGGFPLAEGPHLELLPALADFTLPVYRDQPIRLPGLLELQRVFLEGGYDRIVCSTEAPMGLYALYLKQAFNVPAWFYAHTDWMDFARRTLRFDRRRQDRLRRILRAFYRRFDGVFLLNTEQRDRFASPDMGLRRDRLRLTGHWADARFRRREVDRSGVFAAHPILGPRERILLYAGRLSEEKGVMELPEVLRRVRETHPGARLAFAGTGPCRERLAEAVPDALFLGWLDADRLAEAYSAADVLLLPSWFDTFSCALLEALGCGLPAVAYRSKGPRDILDGGRGGLLADGPAEMAALVTGLLADTARLRALSEAAVLRAADYHPVALMDALLADLGMDGGEPDRDPAPAGPEPDGKESPPDDAEIFGALMGPLKALMEG